jgi:hypothetical protein
LNGERQTGVITDKRAKRPSSWLLFFLAIVGLAALLMLAGEFLTVDTRLERADVITVLSGNDNVRLEATAKLYKEGYAETILLTNTGRTYSELNLPYSQLQVEKLIEMEVPEGAIHLMDFEAKNTGQEATGIIEKMVELRANSVIIVTDAWHTRRTKIIYSDTFSNTGMFVQYYGAASPNFHPKLWWLSAGGWQDVAGEYIRILGYFIKRDTNIPDYPALDFLKKLFL